MSGCAGGPCRPDQEFRPLQAEDELEEAPSDALQLGTRSAPSRHLLQAASASASVTAAAGSPSKVLALLALPLLLLGGGGVAKGLWSSPAGAASGRLGGVVGLSAGTEAHCRMASKGDECYNQVVWAMTKGMKQNPKWYPGLTSKSPFEDFQHHLSSVNKTMCPMPCKLVGCETAQAGSLCASNVQWAMTTGLSDHAAWYPGLSAESSREVFQNHIHAKNKTACSKIACNPQPFKVISLFCWAVVQASGYEGPLVKAQLAKKAGIFACDDYALVSDKDLQFEGVKTVLVSTTKVTGYTAAGTSPNAPVFVEAWGKLKEDGRYSKHDWIVKADPDTVVVPDRLRTVLAPGQQPKNPYPPPYAPAPGSGQWVPNCDKMKNWGAGWGGLWPMMFGSIEIISREAIDNYFANEQMCKDSLPGWEMMGEDRFLGLCFRKLHAEELFIRQGDGTCMGGACTDPNFQAYHPRKDVTSWMQCWGQATR